MIGRTFFLFVALWTGGVLYADTVGYAYDDAGRLISVSYSSGVVITYNYDAAGNQTAKAVTAPAAAASNAPQLKNGAHGAKPAEKAAKTK